MLTQKKIIAARSLMVAAVLGAGGGMWGAGAEAATIVWSASSGSAWLTTTNWTGSAVPGTTDIAQFDNNPSSGGQSTGVGVNFASGLNNGTFAGAAGTLPDQAVGAIIVTSARTNTLFIGNTKSSNSGYMTLNGATFNSQANTILSNSSASKLTIQNNVQSSTGTTFGLVLGNTSNYVQTKVGTASANGSSIAISSTIDQVNSGSSITLLGGGTALLTGGVLDLSGTNSFTGGITVGMADGSQGGTVQIDAAAALPTTGTIVVNNNSQLLLTAAGTYGGTAQSLTLNGIGTTTNSGALRVTAAGVIWQGTTSLGSDTVVSVTTGNSLTLSGNIADNGHQLQKQGAGTLTIGGTGNVMNGSILIGNGVLSVNSGSAVSSGALTLGQTSTNATTVTFNNAAQTVGNLGSTWTATTGTIDQRINLNGTALTVNQTVDGSFGLGAVNSLTSTIAGTGSLNKTGAAALTLSGTQTYTGGTTIGAGTLYVNGSTASANAVVINGGTLAGSGTVGGAVNLNRGTITPGSAALTPGVLHTGALTLTNGTNYNWKLFNDSQAAGTGYDQLNVASLNLGNLTSTTPFNINLSSLSSAGTAGYASFNTSAAESWNIITAGAAITGFNAADFALNNNMTNNLNGGALSLGAAGANLVLTFTPGTSVNLTWNGTSGTQTWHPTSGTQDWLNGATASAYSDGNNVAFDDTAASDTVNVTANVAPGNITFNNSGTYTFTGSTIGGNGSLTKGGSGTVIFQNANTYTGSTLINAGKIQSATPNSLPAGTAVTLANVAGAALDLAGNAQTLAELGGGGTTGGNVTLGGATLTVGDSGSSTYSGVISGTGAGSALIKQGSGALTLGGNNTYGGATNINAGSVALGVSGALPSATAVTLANVAGAALDLNGFNQTIAALSGGGSTGGNVLLTAGVLTVGDATTTTFAGAMSGTGSLVKVGAGKLVLSGGYSYTGSTTVSNGTLELAQPAATVINLYVPSSGDAIAGNIQLDNAVRLNLNGGTLAVGSYSGVGQILVKGSGAIISSVSGDAGFTLGDGTHNPAIVLNSGNAAFTPGDVSQASYADGSFVTAIGSTKSNYTTINGMISGNSDVMIANNLSAGGGAGYLVLGAANTYTGTTAINNTGIILLGATNALPNTDVIVGTNAGLGAPTLDLNGFNQAIASLSDGSQTSAKHFLTITNNGGQNATLTIGGAVTPHNGFGGTINNSGLSDIALVKVGANTLTLSGTNTYTGGTIVSGGTLVVNGVLATSAPYPGQTTTVTVQTGATLAGHGTVGAVVVQSGGTIKPGNSPGTLTAGATTFDGGGNFQFEINDATGTSGSATAGWGLLNVASLDISSLTSGSPFNINMFGLTAANAAGAAPHFSNTGSFDWTFLHSTAGIGGFNSNLFNVDTTNFVNNNALNGGTFTVTELDANDLALHFNVSALPAAVTVTPSTSTSVAAGGTVQVANADGTNRDAATLSTLTVNSSNGVFSQSSLANGPIAAGASQNGTIAFDGSNVLNGVHPTGTLGFTIAGGATAGATGTGDYSFPLTAPTITGNTAPTGANHAFGTAQTATLGASADLTNIESHTTAGGEDLGTKATFLAGTTAAGTTIAESWRTATSGERGTTPVVSDVVQITGTGSNNAYVLEMTYNTSNLDALLLANQSLLNLGEFINGTYDSANGGTWTGTWTLAVANNAHNTEIKRILGAYDNSLIVGHYGVDVADGYVWAVLDTPGTFGVIPEPTSLGLLGLGSLVLVGRRRRKA